MIPIDQIIITSERRCWNGVRWTYYLATQFWFFL